MQRFLVLIPLVSIILLLLPLQAIAEQETPSIDIGQSSWGKTTLRVLVVTNETQSWWQPYFPNMTMRAVQQWNDAFNYFANTYPQYSYLNSLELSTTLSNSSLPGYDIYVVFSPDVLISGIDSLGDTLVIPYENGTIEYANITISAKSQAVDLTRQDYRDTTTHELGHALGLGHCNYTNDLMYPYQDIIASKYAISTLDLYGIALLFEGTNQPKQSDALQIPSTTALPAGIEYSYAPINNPAPTSALDNPILKYLEIFFYNPILSSLSIGLFFCIVLLAIVIRYRRHRRRLNHR